MGVDDLYFAAFGGFISMSISMVHFYPAFILSQTCSFSPLSQLNLVYITYFYNTDRCPAQGLEFIFPEDYHLNVYAAQIVMPKHARWEPISRKFMQIYYVLDIFWVFSSIKLVYAAFWKITGFKSLFFYIPWISCTFLSIMIDLFGSCFYVSHVYVDDFESWLNLVGANHTGFSLESNTVIRTTVQAPALNMFFYYNRFFVFYFMNVILFMKISLAAKKAFYTRAPT